MDLGRAAVELIQLLRTFINSTAKNPEIPAVFSLVFMYNGCMRFSPPEQYMLCTNSACKKSGNCLRNLVFDELSENDEKIFTLNPKCFPKEDEECRHFRPLAILTLDCFYRGKLLFQGQKLRFHQEKLKFHPGKRFSLYT